jgi:hypothetical protein
MMILWMMRHCEEETVHEKWNINTGISGDAMLILAYQYFEQYEPVILEISKVVQQNSS